MSGAAFGPDRLGASRLRNRVGLGSECVSSARKVTRCPPPWREDPGEDGKRSGPAPVLRAAVRAKVRAKRRLQPEPSPQFGSAAIESSGRGRCNAGQASFRSPLDSRALHLELLEGRCLCVGCVQMTPGNGELEMLYRSQ